MNGYLVELLGDKQRDYPIVYSHFDNNWDDFLNWLETMLSDADDDLWITLLEQVKLQPATIEATSGDDITRTFDGSYALLRGRLFIQKPDGTGYSKKCKIEATSDGFIAYIYGNNHRIMVAQPQLAQPLGAR